LVSMGMPAKLHELAIEKVLNEILDASNYVMFAQIDSDDDSNNEESESLPDESGGAESPTPVDLSIAFPDQPYALVAINDMAADSTVFAIDHMWCAIY